MGILNDLYHGKGEYFGESRINTQEYIIAVGKLADLEEKITSEHPEISDLLAKYLNVQATVTSIAEYEMFAAGFRTGAQLMLEMLRPKGEKRGRTA